MSEKLDSLVGNHQAVRLSGGQRQRLAPGCMIPSNPKVLILDEASSALDTETQAWLHQAMQALEGWTTPIVTR